MSTATTGTVASVCGLRPSESQACRIPAAERLDDRTVAGNGLWFNAAYTYNDFFFDRDAIYESNHLPGVPSHNLRAELLYKHPAGISAGPEVEWTPRAYFADNANQVEIDPYAVLNFRFGYERGSGWSGYVEGRNLLDRRYISSTVVVETADATSELFNPGVGRAVYGGIRYTWQQGLLAYRRRGRPVF